MTDTQAVLPRPRGLELKTTTTPASHFRPHSQRDGCSQGEGCRELAAGAPAPTALLTVGLASDVLFRHSASASHLQKEGNDRAPLSGVAQSQMNSRL